VHIEYPERFGFGEKPIRVFLGGLLRTAWWGGLAFFVLPFGGRIAWDLTSYILSDFGETKAYERWIVLGLFALFSGWGIYLTLRFIDGVIRLWRGAADLQQRVVVEGEVVKSGSGRVAVADGKSEEVNAWIPPIGAPHPPRGSIVRFTRSPRLWFVEKVEVLSRAAEEPSATTLEDHAATHTRQLQLVALRELTGLALNPVTPDNAIPFASLPGGTVSAFADSEDNRVLVAEFPVPPLVAKTILAVLASSSKDPGSVAPELGDSATWLPGGYLVVRDGERMLLTQVQLKGPPESEAKEMAEKLARHALGEPSALPGADAAGE